MSFYSDFADYYEAVFPYREVVHQFLLAELPGPGARILDLGCGTGHYCGRLAAAGHQVVGIDLDPAMVAQAQRQYPAAEFRRLDLLDISTLPGPGAFDLTYCIGNVAAHLPQERVPELLAKLATRLAPGGKWLFQVVNWDHILAKALPAGRYRFPPRTVGESGVVFHREYRQVTETSLLFHTRLEGPGGVIFQGEVPLYPVRAAQYLQWHAEAGFELAGHYADYQRRPFTPAASGGNICLFRVGRSSPNQPRSDSPA